MSDAKLLILALLINAFVIFLLCESILWGIAHWLPLKLDIEMIVFGGLLVFALGVLWCIYREYRR